MYRTAIQRSEIIGSSRENKAFSSLRRRRLAVLAAAATLTALGLHMGEQPVATASHASLAALTASSQIHRADIIDDIIDVLGGIIGGSGGGDGGDDGDGDGGTKP